MGATTRALQKVETIATALEKTARDAEYLTTCMVQEDDVRYTEELAAAEKLAMGGRTEVERAAASRASAEKHAELVEEYATKRFAELEPLISKWKGITMRNYCIAQWVIVKLVNTLLEGGVFIDHGALRDIAESIARTQAIASYRGSADGNPTGTCTEMTSRTDNI